MPKPFSKQEREKIRKQLITAGREHFSRFGLRKANIAELAKSVGIAKGSFYLFFNSKEDLFITLLNEIELEVRSILVEEVEQLQDNPETMFRRFLTLAHELLDSHPILRILTDPEEAQPLFRKIPESTMQANREDDDAFFGQLISQWQKDGLLIRKDPLLLAGLTRVIFALSLQKDLIGERYTDIVALIIDSLTSFLVIKKDTP